MLSRDTRVNCLIGTNHALSHFYQLCLAPLFLAWQVEFGASFAELGLCISLMLLTTGALQTPMGFLVDRYGARPFLIGGSLAMSGSVLVMSFATSVWQIVALAVISGIGNSVIHPADYAILAGSVRKEVIGRSFAMHTFSGNVGYALAPVLMALGLTTIGWRGALFAAGLLGIGAVVAITLQSRILTDQARPERKAAGSMSTRDLFTSRTLWLFFGFYMLSAMASSSLQTWLISVLHNVNGFDIQAASIALTCVLVGNSAGVILGGWVADRFVNRLLLFTVGLTLVSSSTLLMVALLPMPELVLFAIISISGFAMGASRTPRDVMLKEASPKGQIGKVFGFVSSGLPFGSAITPVPFGFLLDHGHTSLVLPFVAVILVVSLCCMGTAKMSADSDTAPEAVPAE
jgi:FSR family fosmidomycin resistance protein-like MFS transporter